MTRGCFVLGVALVVAGPAAALAQPVGSEFQVNVYTTTGQFDPVISSTPDGRFVVVWESSGQDGDATGIFGRRYDAKGNSLGSEFRVNTYTTNYQLFPSVASAVDGSFVVAWASYVTPITTGVFGQRYDSLGNPTGSEFAISSATPYVQHFPSVASVGSGFVVAWRDLDAYAQGVSARRLDASGTPLGLDFRVNTTTLSDQNHPSVAGAADGTFVVVWQSKFQDGSDFGVFGRRFDAAGNPVSAEFRVNTYTTGFQGEAHVAEAPDGRFVVVWSSTQDGSGYGVFGRRYNAAGVAQGSEFEVNAFTSGPQDVRSVSMAADGTFVVVWSSTQGGAGNQPTVRRFDASGAPLAAEFLANQFTQGTVQMYAGVASGANGRFVVAWNNFAQDGDGLGIFGRRFGAPDSIFANGFESGNLSAWTSSSTDGGNLAVTAGSALNGTSMGLRALVNDTNSLFVEDDTPASETRYRARFYFDPNGFDPGEADGHLRVRLLLAQDDLNQRLITIVLKRSSGQYSVEGRVRLNDGNRVDTPFFNITNAPHSIEFDWQRAGSVETADGTFELFIDGVSVATLSGLDDGGSAVEYVRMGVFSVKTAAAGTLFFDQFVSRRRTLIGP